MPRKKATADSKKSKDMISSRAATKSATKAVRSVTALKEAGVKITYKDFEAVHEIVAQYQDSQDKKYRDRVVEIHMTLVKKIATGLARRSTDPIDDLIQIGSIGLIKAVEYFNPNAGARFSTYATHLITGEIRHYLRDKTSMIRAPRELQELSFRISKVVQRLRIELNREPTDLEVAAVLSDVKTTKLKAAHEVDRRKTLVSLDQTVNTASNESEVLLIDTLADMKEATERERKEDFILINRILNEEMKPKLAEIVRLTYLEDIPQYKISELLGISQMQVSRRLRKAMAILVTLYYGAKKQGDPDSVESDNEDEEEVSDMPKRVTRASLGAKLKSKKQKLQEEKDQAKN